MLYPNGTVFASALCLRETLLTANRVQEGHQCTYFVLEGQYLLMYCVPGGTAFYSEQVLYAVGQCFTVNRVLGEHYLSMYCVLGRHYLTVNKCLSGTVILPVYVLCPRGTGIDSQQCPSGTVIANELVTRGTQNGQSTTIS